MPSFALPRAILQSVSELSGETYRDVSGVDLTEALKQRGFELTMPELWRVMRELKNADYLDCEFLGGFDAVELIKLEHRGRQEVEGWPTTPGQPTEQDVAALVQVLMDRADDPSISEPERGKARAAASAVKDLGINVGSQMLGAWLQHVAGLQ